MQYAKKNLYKIALIAFLVAMPVVSFAQTPSQPTAGTTPSNPDAGKIVNPLASKGITDIPSFIKIFLVGALKIGMPIVALAIMYCGFLFVKARGNSEELSKAKDALLYTLLGAAILLGAWAIAQVISNTVLQL